jgi:pimeloyl-ACP methyl ester carboxylesterase
MFQFPDALCLNVSPSLQVFDRPLLKVLSRHLTVGQWEYSQTQDEPMSIEIALELLDDYLSQGDRPVHLLGHGTGGLLGLLYARRHPETVRSLTLLSVGVDPAVDWQSCYYNQLQCLPYSRSAILTRTVHEIFGCQSPTIVQQIRRRFDRALSQSLSLHTLYQQGQFFPGGVPVPLLVCGSENDVILESSLLQGWQPWFKDGDRLWQSPEGGHFFHYFYPQPVGEQITQFWDEQVTGKFKQSRLTVLNRVSSNPRRLIS